MFVTNLLPHDAAFNTLPALADVNKDFNLPFSSAACLSGRFPIITPAGFVTADDRKFRYVHSGYYQNPATATGYNILTSLQFPPQNLSAHFITLDLTRHHPTP